MNDWRNGAETRERTAGCLRTVALICGLLVSAIAPAGTQSGTITDVLVRASDGLIYFMMTGQKTGSPTCATNSYWVIKDENSNAGKQQYAMLLAAQASGKTIIVQGAGACTRWGDGEDVQVIVLKD